jgi:MFS family permease
MSTLRSLLAHRNYRLLWTGQVVSNFGDALTNLALLIVAQRLTGSTAAVAGTAIAIALPQLLFGMIAGTYIDRWDRARVMIVSDVVRAVMVLGFVFVGRADQMWLLYTMAFLQATVGTFFLPAKSALLPAIVDGDELLAANSVSETSRVIFMLAGTGAAGVLAAIFESLAVVFWIDSATFIASAVLLSMIRADTRPEISGAAPSVIEGIRSGIAVVARSRVLVGVMVGGAVVMLGLGAVNVLLVPFVIDVLEVGEAWFGALEAAQVASMVLAGAIVAVLSKRFRPTNIISAALVGLGLGVMAMALVGAAWHMMLVLFLAGWFITPLQASVATLVQTEVPDELRGRTGAALSTVMTTANVMSMAAAGVAAAAVGVRSVFVASGLLAVCAGVLTALLFRGVVVQAEDAAAEFAVESAPA